MQRVIDMTVIKAVIPATVLSALAIGIDPSGTEQLVSLVKLGVFIATIIGIAFVMRRDVSDLLEWRRKHIEYHDDLREFIGEIRQDRRDMQRRIEKLETHVEDCNFRRRKGDN